MFLSTDPLPAELVRALTIFTDQFRKTANTFLSIPTVREHVFTRVCELHNTLEILSTVNQPIGTLMQILGPRVTSGHESASDSAREYLGFMLNAEFILFEAYRIYGLRMNPSLAHWVDVCREYESAEKQKKQQLGDDRSVESSGLREEVLRIRVAFVKGILGEHGDRLAGLSPHEFASRGLEFVVDVESFTEALYEQGIYDKPMEGRKNLKGGAGGAGRGHGKELGVHGTGASVGGSGCSSASGFTSGAQTPSNGRPSPLVQDTAAEVSTFLVRAMSEELRPNVVNSLLAILKSTPSLLTAYPLDFLSSPTLAGLISNNPVLARGILLLLLSPNTTTATPTTPANTTPTPPSTTTPPSQSSTSHRRQEILTSLSFLAPTLNALETINILITQTSALTKDETNLLIHNFLSNGTRSAEEMLNGEYRDGGSGKRAQARQVQLLCLFVQSLLRAGVISLRDVYYEVQMLGVTFMYVKEARDLWKAARG